MLALIAAIALGYCQSKSPAVQLKVVRQTLENGKPVVFFRITDSANRTLHVAVPKRCPHDGKGDDSPPDLKDFPRSCRGSTDFTVPAITTTEVWHLAVEVISEDTSVPSRIKRTARFIWYDLRSSGNGPIRQRLRCYKLAWSTAAPERTTLFSDDITNPIAQKIRTTP